MAVAGAGAGGAMGEVGAWAGPEVGAGAGAGAAGWRQRVAVRSPASAVPPPLPPLKALKCICAPVCSGVPNRSVYGGEGGQGLACDKDLRVQHIGRHRGGGKYAPQKVLMDTF